MTTQSELFSREFMPFAERMQYEALPKICIYTFAYYYQLLCQGQTGHISEDEINPVETLPDAETFAADLKTVGQTALSKTVMIKLNGGLGTSMGLEGPKSLLVVKDDFSFLDIVARHAIQRHIPLILMNSFATHPDTVAEIANYPELQTNLPLYFEQSKVPKVNVPDLTPVDWPDNPDLEWCPPGHGDIYPSLFNNRVLDNLLAAGYRYAFISNVDNLGATINDAILGYFVQHNLPFMMEVADRTPMDKKGGHLAQLPNGQLILRESAQCPPQDTEAFQNINRHKYFNTNNLWLNLQTLKETMTTKNYLLGLPLICNRKTVDPRDPDSPPVYQLETAMGSAISVFPNAQAIRVPRTRFAPVKTTEDLVAIRSDLYTLTADFQITPNSQRTLPPIAINLDQTHYKFVNALDEHFPAGIPSLIDCASLDIKGPITFGKDVTLKGTVTLANETNQPLNIETGAVIEDNA